MTAALRLPFEIPVRVDPLTSQLDRSYLDRVLLALDHGETITNLDGIFSAMADFTAQGHTQVLVYAPWQVAWHACNYAYTDLRYNLDFFELFAKPYLFRGSDGSVEIGVEKEIWPHYSRHQLPHLKPHIIPLTLDRQLKAVIWAHEIDINKGHYDIMLYIGDKYTRPVLPDMPRFDVA